ncbi:MAG: hypothetical protein WBC70_16235 [Candidatus Aminicenantales bacterium]
MRPSACFHPSCPTPRSLFLPSHLFLPTFLLTIFLLSPVLLAACTQQDSRPTPAAAYSLAEAQKVLRAIAKIEAEAPRPWDGPLRPVTVTESELNSYIAYRIETEKEDVMKELRLKIFPKNKIEGKIHIDLRGRDIPGYIRPEMDVFFAADVLVSGGAVKIDLQKLFLGDEPIPPLIIDLVIAVSAKLSGQEPTSISDWYELPFGIKDIKTEKGRAVFFY